MANLLTRLFGKNEAKVEMPVIAPVVAQVVETKEQIAKPYTLADAFESGKTILSLRDNAADFVKINYGFSADCTDKGGYDISFNPSSANGGLNYFIPRAILPDKRLETKRDMPWNTWNYRRIDRAEASLFIKKKNLEMAVSSLEKAVDMIPRSAVITYAGDNGYIQCCHGKVNIHVSSADGKTFDYILNKRIKETKVLEENFAYLGRFYQELGKEKIATYLDKKIAVKNSDIRGKNLLSDKYEIESLAQKNALDYTHPFLIKKLNDLDKQVVEYTALRDNELNTLNEMYGSSLTTETLAVKRNAIIGKYDPQIAQLAEKKYDLQKPSREVKDAIARLGDKDIRAMPRADYEKVSRAYRIMRNYSAEKK
jgi:hypothetical protein